MLGSSYQEDDMKTNQHTAEQIIKILEQAEKGDQTIAAVCRAHGIAENTFYRRCSISGMSFFRPPGEKTTYNKDKVPCCRRRKCSE